MIRTVYDELKDHFKNNPDVDVTEGKGAQGLKHNGKMFVMFYKGDITVKLKPESVEKQIKKGNGYPHDPGTGKPMKDRLLVPVSNKDKWIDMCELSLSDIR